MRTFAICLLLLLSVSLYAQNSLTSRQNSVYKYAYKITKQEALTLYRSGMKKVDEKYLHTLVDSCLSNSIDLPPLPPGNYLLVQAKDNSLLYELQTVSGLQYKLVSNHRDLVIALHDKYGSMVTDAQVYLNKKMVPYDATTQTFRRSKKQERGKCFCSL